MKILAIVLCVVFMVELALFNTSGVNAILYELGVVWEARVLMMVMVGVGTMVAAWWAASKVWGKK